MLFCTEIIFCNIQNPMEESHLLFVKRPLAILTFVGFAYKNISSLTLVNIFLFLQSDKPSQKFTKLCYAWYLSPACISMVTPDIAGPLWDMNKWKAII